MYVYVWHTCQTNEHRQLNDCTGKLIKYRILFGYPCSEPIPPSTNKCNHRFCRPLKEQRAEKYFVEIALIIFSVTRNVWHYDRAKKRKWERMTMVLPVPKEQWREFHQLRLQSYSHHHRYCHQPSPTLDFLKKSLTFLYWFLNYYRFHNNNNNNDGWKNTPYVFNIIIIIIGYWKKEKNAKQTYCQRHCHRHRRR